MKQPPAAHAHTCIAAMYVIRTYGGVCIRREAYFPEEEEEDGKRKPQQLYTAGISAGSAKRIVVIPPGYGTRRRAPSLVVVVVGSPQLPSMILLTSGKGTNYTRTHTHSSGFRKQQNVTVVDASVLW